MLRYTTDRVRPGLVAFYDIWPGNGSGSILTTLEPARGNYRLSLVGNVVLQI